jgi:hypothetical protein
VALPGRERIHYIVEPKDPNVPPITWSVTVLSDGELTLDQDLAISWEGGRRNRYGLGWHEHAKLDSEIHGHLDLTYESVVDEGPFYLRFLISGIDPETGEHGCGVAETVVPDRIRIPWMNPLIRMRRHRVGGSNSIWVPLFCGSRRDRIARLLRHWGSKQRKAP